MRCFARGTGQHQQRRIRWALGKREALRSPQSTHVRVREAGVGKEEGDTSSTTCASLPWRSYRTLGPGLDIPVLSATPPMAIRGVRAEALKRAWGRERTRTRLGAEVGSALGAEEALQRATLAMKEAARRSDSQGAVEELVQLGESGYTPDLMAATTALSACASAVDEERALVVFQEVFGSGLLEPDELAFTMLLKCFAQQRPPDWEQIASRLGSMRFTYSIAPSALTYVASRAHGAARALGRNCSMVRTQIQRLAPCVRERE